VVGGRCDQHAARLEHPCYLLEQGDSVLDVLEDLTEPGGAERRGAEGQRVSFARAHELDCARAQTGAAQSLRGDIDARHRETGLEQRRREPAAPAAHVEHPHPGREPAHGSQGSQDGSREKLDRIKDLYLTVEAIGDDNVGKHFDELMQRQRELISDYFKETGIASGKSRAPQPDPPSQN